MKIIPRYLLFSFVKMFCLWFICLIGIYIVFDIFTNYDRFFELGLPLVETLKLIGVFYFYKSLPVYDVISGVLAMASAMITIAIMTRNNELVPLLAAGIPEKRIIRPILIAAICTTLLATGLREGLLPNCQRELDEKLSPLNLMKEEGREMHATRDFSNGIIIHGDEAFYAEKRFTRPSFQLPPSLAEYGNALKAESAIFVPENEKHPRGYLLQNIEIPLELKTAPSLAIGEKKIIITPNDAPDWLEPDDCFIACEIPFEYLASGDTWGKYASIPSMIHVLNTRCIDIGTDTQTKFHARLLKPIMDILLLFLGVSVIVIYGDKKDIFKAIGIAAFLVVGFFLVKYTSEFLWSGFGVPIFGAWFPLMIFFPLAVNLYARISN